MSLIPCYNCKTQISDKALICPNCKQSKQVNCYECLNNFDLQFSACPNCGAPKDNITSKLKRLSSDVYSIGKDQKENLDNLIVKNKLKIKRKIYIIFSIIGVFWLWNSLLIFDATKLPSNEWHLSSSLLLEDVSFNCFNLFYCIY